VSPTAKQHGQKNNKKENDRVSVEELLDGHRGAAQRSQSQYLSARWTKPPLNAFFMSFHAAFTSCLNF
jgi:hypothetical protein